MTWPPARSSRAGPKSMPDHWMKLPRDGEHYRIAFDKPNTWSQKYNLIWDKLLGLGIFPPEVARREVAYYKKMGERYGVPLDSRTRLTKADWCLWSATLADDRGDFEAIVSPIYDYLNETTARLPFVDSYLTDNPKSDGMRARPVIGGVFIKMLEDPATWKKWSSHDRRNSEASPHRPCRRDSPRSCRHLSSKAADWRYHVPETRPRLERPGFDEQLGNRARRLRHKGNSGRRQSVRRGTRPTSGCGGKSWCPLKPISPGSSFSSTTTKTSRSTWTARSRPGRLATSSSINPLKSQAQVQAKLKRGAKVLVAVHCHQTEGGQGIDVGLIDVVESDP